MHDLSFKVATLRNAKDGEPKVVTYDIPKFVKMVAKPKISDTPFQAYHNQKAAQKRFDNEAREAREAGNKELANELKLKSKAKKDALSGTKDGKAMMPFTFKNDLTYKVIKDDWKQRDNDQIDAFSLIMLDIESKISKEEIHEALKDFEYVLWPTITHTSDDPRFRVVLFPATPLAVDEAQSLIFRIDANLPARNPLTSKTRAVDPASLDVGRLMYLPLWLIGHPDEYFHVYNEGALVTAHSFKLSAAQLLEVAERAKKSDEARADRKASSIKAAVTRATDDSTLIEKNGQVWLNPNGYLASDSGWHLIGSINGKISGISCPAHGDTNGSEWVSLNSHTGRPQLNCKHCGTIKMLHEVSDRDDDSSKLVFVKRKKQSMPAISREEPVTIKPASVGLVMNEIRDIQEMNERYLPDTLLSIVPDTGIFMVKSPKGTGKTEFLKLVAQDCDKKGKSVLLLGHRVFLLKNIADRTGLDYYREIEDRGTTDSMALCLNSLTRINPAVDDPYHTIIIDESEQVLLHLNSRTMGRKRATVFNNLTWVIRKAKRIIVLDADLSSELTLTQIKNLRGAARMEKEPAIGIINNYVFEGRTTVLYPSKNQVIGEMLGAAIDGTRCYVATNSAREAHLIADVLTENDISNLVITARTNESAECVAFIADPTNESKKYQVIVASPTAQTGISIDSNPDGSPQFDIVYGSFLNSVGTFQDIDQALSRVRGCDDTRVWVQQVEHKAARETEEQIFDKIVETERASRMMIVGEEELRLSKGEYMWAIVCAGLTWTEKDWSVEKLEKFAFLRKATGYILSNAEEDELIASWGKSVLKAAKAREVGGHLYELLDTPDISREELEDLKNKGVLTHAESLMVERSEYRRLIPGPLTFETLDKALKEELIRGSKQLRNIVQMSHDQRVSFDKAVRKATSPTFTDATHRAMEGMLLAEILAAGGLNFARLLEAAQTTAKGQGPETEITVDQLTAMAEHFDSKKRVFANYFKKPKIAEPTKNLKKVWEATCGHYFLPLKTVKKGPRGQQVAKYFINWEKKEMLLQIFDKENGKY